MEPILAPFRVIPGETSGVEISMRKHAQLLTLTLIAGSAILFGMVLAGGVRITPATLAEGELKPASLKPAAVSATSSSTRAAVAYPSFADIVEKANPAVVSIISTEM